MARALCLHLAWHVTDLHHRPPLILTPAPSPPRLRTHTFAPNVHQSITQDGEALRQTPEGISSIRPALPSRGCLHANVGLQRSPAPSKRASNSSNSSDGWETAQSHSSLERETLPQVAERAEPAIQTPRKTAIAQPASAAQATKSSQLPQSSIATPTRTPKHRTGNLVLPSEEMHPAQHHASTAKPRDEARWLGFQTMDAHTAPPKSTGIAAGQTTPSKTQAPITPAKVKGSIASLGFPFQGFNFRVKSPVAGLSPSSSSILKGYKDAPVADARALFNADEFTAPEDMGAKRKTAVPTGKIARYSDAHMVSALTPISSMNRILSATRNNSRRWTRLPTIPLLSAPTQAATNPSPPR